MTWQLLEGDCRTHLAGMEPNSVDALVTDPPAGIEFMGKAWDSFREREATASGTQTNEWGAFGGQPYARESTPRYTGKGGSRDIEARRAFVAELTVIFRECLRVLKPGAHGLVWAIPRTSHWTATALEDAGFEIRDVVVHLYGSGFPKSLDVGKAMDKLWPWRRDLESVQWDGWGTALKPGAEHWILARKPLSEKTVVANVARWGTGAINIDGCRVKTFGPHGTQGRALGEFEDGDGFLGQLNGQITPPNTQGRFPANVILSHRLTCKVVGERRVRAGNSTQGVEHGTGEGSTYRSVKESGPHYADADGYETVEVWECDPDCAVAALDAQSGERVSGFMRAGTQREGIGYHGGLGTQVRNDTYGDRGGASRFFYVAKASRAERNAGLPEGERNGHPTVKSVGLMRYLCRLVTPPGGTVLDPFAGSGSTGLATLAEGFNFIGIEREQEYVEIARARLRAVNGSGP